MTLRANSFHFHRRSMNLEAEPPRRRGHRPCHRLVADLRRAAAAAADQELMGVRMGVGVPVAGLLRTADKGVQPLDLG